MSGYELTMTRSSAGMFSTARELQKEKTLFVIVNVLDIILTFALLQTGSFYESNPIANFILDGWGFAGMTIYKLGLIFGVMMIANYIATRRIKTSRSLLTIGTIIVGGVVVYSSILVGAHFGMI